MTNSRNCQRNPASTGARKDRRRRRGCRRRRRHPPPQNRLHRQTHRRHHQWRKYRRRHPLTHHRARPCQGRTPHSPAHPPARLPRRSTHVDRRPGRPPRQHRRNLLRPQVRRGPRRYRHRSNPGNTWYRACQKPARRPRQIGIPVRAHSVALPLSSSSSSRNAPVRAGAIS